MSVIFTKPEKKNQWEQLIAESKQKLGRYYLLMFSLFGSKKTKNVRFP